METSAQKQTVIVTSGKSRVAYNIVRSLGKQGCKVVVGDAEPWAMAAASRYAHGSFVYPSPFSEPEAFKDCLLRHIKEWQADVLIPVLEETFLVAKYKDELSRYVKLVIPDYQQILAAHNKERWGALADTLGVPHPRSLTALNLQAEMSLCHALRYPVLIKPNQGGGGWGIAEVGSAADLGELLGGASYCGQPWERFFVQEKMGGETHCVAMLFCRGQLRAKVAYKQLREYPVRFGQAVLRQSIRSEQAESHLQKLLEAMEWHGVCQADFIVDPHTGTPYLIDINPRFWGSVAQAIASGVDFPWLIYRIAVDGDVEPVASFATGVKSRWLGGDLRAFWPQLKSSHDKTRFLADFFSLAGWWVYRDDFDLQDPLPFFTWIAYGLRKTIKSTVAVGPPSDRLEGVWE
ncbi:MAG: ATP-grasp domain-containing protein [Proteobacteria bacterium]|nr:ATP-grasp domain-containing protein [Pseudomonadota bacterium]MBU1640698.1 ATP-grasp domain-containing protein [Pseudomonadota bacterium]